MQKLEPAVGALLTGGTTWTVPSVLRTLGSWQPSVQALVIPSAQLTHYNVLQSFTKQKGQGDLGHPWSHSVILKTGKPKPMEVLCSPRSNSPWAMTWKLKPMLLARSQACLFSWTCFFITREKRTAVAVKQGLTYRKNYPLVSLTPTPVFCFPEITNVNGSVCASHMSSCCFLISHTHTHSFFNKNGVNTHTSSILKLLAPNMLNMFWGPWGPTPHGPEPDCGTYLPLTCYSHLNNDLCQY